MAAEGGYFLAGVPALCHVGGRISCVPKKAKKAKKKRVCAREECTTVLSRYNKGKYCGAHEDDPRNVRYPTMHATRKR